MSKASGSVRALLNKLAERVTTLETEMANSQAGAQQHLDSQPVLASSDDDKPEVTSG